jgi:hypothetical protein
LLDFILQINLKDQWSWKHGIDETYSIKEVYSLISFGEGRRGRSIEDSRIRLEQQNDVENVDST